MGKILALANQELASGFRLAGLDTVTVHGAEETYRELFRAVNRRSHEIIIMPQEHLTEFDDRKRREIDELSEQVVVPVPMTNLENQPSPRAFVSDLVRRAVGFSIKI